MRKWEDIIKEKVEEPEGALPESVFEEFQARRRAAAPAPSSKRFPLVWVAIPAVAAGLAAILLLRQPSVPESGIQVIGQQPSAPMAVVTDSIVVSEREPIPQPSFKPKKKQETLPVVMEEEPPEEAVVSQPVEEEKQPQEEISIPTVSSPFIPQETKKPRSVKFKVIPAAGIVAGGGLLAAVLTLPRGAKEADTSSLPDYDNGTGAIMDPGMTHSGDHEPLVDPPKHSFPLKVGLSTKIPVTNRLFISTGLDYSLYQSTFKYASAEIKQTAHYLGIPVKINWSLASSRLFDVYVGGGLEGDVCVSATLAGNKIKKDGFGLSLQAGGGVQLNVTKRFGLYVEPELSWRVPMNTAVLSTYRSEHPLMFSLSAGLRFNLGTRKQQNN